MVESSQGVAKAPVQPLPGPAEGPGDGGAVQAQLPGDLGDVHPLVVIQLQHLPLAGKIQNKGCIKGT